MELHFIALGHVFRATIKRDKVSYGSRAITFKSGNDFHKPRAITIKSDNFCGSVEALFDNAKM
jgi:hypothetical protein